MRGFFVTLRGPAAQAQRSALPLLMRTFIPVVLLFILTTVVFQTAVRIEVLNFHAGSYLPRKDRNPDGTFGDGKWRLSSVENGPRDQLRGLVETFGLLQYLLAPLLLIFAIIVFLKSSRSSLKVGATLSLVVSIISISLMLYRQYYQSLGW
jgi:hypothetical protein